ncbi:MAG: hypothetical protein HRT61_20705 [Ekhidna sp.]|nr:hypothetical protein [Ekhidna sp.]
MRKTNEIRICKSRNANTYEILIYDMNLCKRIKNRFNEVAVVRLVDGVHISFPYTGKDSSAQSLRYNGGNGHTITISGLPLLKKGVHELPAECFREESIFIPYSIVKK